MSDSQEPPLRIEKLQPVHELDDFDCGVNSLNRFLQRHAWNNQKANSAQTYVACRGNKVLGYYSLTVGPVAHQEAAPRIRKGLARYPIPVLILTRLAIHQEFHGAGLGKGLLKNALKRTAQAADIAGIRALLVHAKDDQARAFYERFDFEPSPTDSLHLFLLLKDIRLHI